MSPVNHQLQDFGNAWNDVKERFSTEIQLRHYSHRTFEAYGAYIRKFAEFCDWKDPEKIKSYDAKITHHVHPHILRHSFTNHLLAGG